MKTETLSAREERLSGTPATPPLLLPPFAPAKMLPPADLEAPNLLIGISDRAVVITTTLAEIIAHGVPHGGINE